MIEMGRNRGNTEVETGVESQRGKQRERHQKMQKEK